MTQEVEISRELLPAPTPDNPNRQVYQIQYKVGSLPPHFIYIDKAEWTEGVEKNRIKEDLKKVMEHKRTTTTL
jgi:hypothetical protein